MPIPFLATAVALFRTTVRNPAVRAHALGFFLFSCAELMSWTGLLIYAHEETGAGSVSLVVVARLVPAALLAPFVASIGDRLSRHMVLIAAFGIQAVTIGGIGYGILTHASPLTVYAIAIVSSVALTLTRPIHSALVPEMANEPRDLTAANGLTAISEGVGTFVGPLLLGVLIAHQEPTPGDPFARRDVGGAFFVASAALVVSALLASRAVTITHAQRRETGAPGHHQRRATPRPSLGSFRTHLLGGLREVVRDRDFFVVMALLTGRYVILGGLEVALVLVSIDLLGAGEDGAGFLMAALGFGVILGGGAAFTLAGRRRLAPWMGIASILVGLQFALLGASRSELQAVALLAAGGLGLAVLDAVGATLLQRIAPDEALARVFGVLQGMLLLGQAVGAVVVGPLAAAFGIPTALLFLGLLLPIVSLAVLPRFGELDRRLVIPLVQIRLLRRLPLFAPLRGPTLESIARHLRPESVAAGGLVVRQGEPGRDFYVIASGTAAVDVDGASRPALGPGDHFGEIALLHDIPRTATVRATTDLELFALDRDTFLAALRGDPVALLAATRIAAERTAQRSVVPEGAPA